MPITITQEVYEIRSISPVLINPSITEGQVNATSILGPDRGITIERFAPTFLSDPVITGSPNIPAILTCSAGVVSSSPSAVRTYQWKSDGVDLVGETSPTLLTYNDLDATTITCEVDATNVLGTDTALSNGIAVAVLEPVILSEQDFYTIGGLQQYGQQNLMHHRAYAVSGLAPDDYSWVTGFATYAITGQGAEGRMAVTFHETYIVVFNTLIETLTLVNPGAELGNASGWTVTEGGLTVSTTPTPATGTYSFKATGSVTVKYYQDVSIPAPSEADVDAGRVSASMSYTFTDGVDSFTTVDDLVRGYIECLNAGGTVLATLTFDGTLNPAQGFVWLIANSSIEVIPALTRTLRLRMELINSSFVNGCQIDNHSIQLWLAT